ncbi:MAG: type IV pilus biogenesis/stability protein PilW [Agarilytica sp.]
MSRMSKCFLLIVIAVLSACVTVEEGGGGKVDKKKMLESNIKLGMAYLNQGQRDSALRAFSRALEADKNSAEAQMGMALIHQVNGEMEMAEKRFQKALKVRSDFSRANIEFSYGRFLMDQKKYEEAIAYFESASKDLTYRSRVKAIYNLGLCAEKLDDELRAIRSYEHALNINPNFAPAALELAHKKFAAEEFPLAKRYLDSFAKNARQSARSLWLGIRIERIFENKDKEASYVLALKNLHPYSREYLQYKQLIASEAAASGK